MATAANVVPIKTEPELRQLDKKWGGAVMSHGRFIVPSILLRAQARLLVRPTQMIVLLQLIEHWWGDSKIFPSMKTIGDRINLSPKQVQRTIDSLVKKGLIAKKQRRLPGRGKVSNEYDLTGLVKRLKALEPEFAETRRQRAAAEKPGGLLAAKKGQ